MSDLHPHRSVGCSCTLGAREQYREGMGQTAGYDLGFDPVSWTSDWIYTNNDSVQEHL